MTEEELEKMAERASQIVIDSDPFRPIDYEKIADKVEKILRDRKDQEFGREVREQAIWAVRAIIRAALILVGMLFLAILAWVTTKLGVK